MNLVMKNLKASMAEWTNSKQNYTKQEYPKQQESQNIKKIFQNLLIIDGNNTLKELETETKPQ